MLPWLIAIFIAALLLATLVLIAYRLSPFQQPAVSTSPIQKRLLYFIVCYPLFFIIVLLMFGTEHNVPNTKHHIPSAFVFMIGHALLGIMAIIVSQYLTKRNKINIIFLIANCLAALLYITFIVLLLQMGFHQSTTA